MLPNNGVEEAGLCTTVFPNTNAGAIFHIGIANGKFQGVIMPTTPSGDLVVPVIDAKSLSNIENKIGQAVSEGGELMFGGKVLKNDSLKNGNFIEPTLFGNIKPDSMIATEEVFGPVLALINSKNYEDSLNIANQTSYGLSAGIFTSNLNLAMDFANKINAGIVKINGETAGVEPQVPFGGMKESSSGAREQGKSAVDFFTQIKTVYVERSA
jgi:aldehyde dehydrogenase (NAD+)